MRGAGATLAGGGHVRLATWREAGALFGVCLAAVLPTALAGGAGRLTPRHAVASERRQRPRHFESPHGIHVGRDDRQQLFIGGVGENILGAGADEDAARPGAPESAAEHRRPGPERIAERNVPQLEQITLGQAAGAHVEDALPELADAYTRMVRLLTS